MRPRAVRRVEPSKRSISVRNCRSFSERSIPVGTCRPNPILFVESVSSIPTLGEERSEGVVLQGGNAKVGYLPAVPRVYLREGKQRRESKGRGEGAPLLVATGETTVFFKGRKKTTENIYAVGARAGQKITVE